MFNFTSWLLYWNWSSLRIVTKYEQFTITIFVFKSEYKTISWFQPQLAKYNIWNEWCPIFIGDTFYFTSWWPIWWASTHISFQWQWYFIGTHSVFCNTWQFTVMYQIHFIGQMLLRAVSMCVDHKIFNYWRMLYSPLFFLTNLWHSVSFTHYSDLYIWSHWNVIQLKAICKVNVVTKPSHNVANQAVIKDNFLGHLNVTRFVLCTAIKCVRDWPYLEFAATSSSNLY